MNLFDYFDLPWPLQNGQFCHFSTWSHFSNIKCVFEQFSVSNNSYDFKGSFLYVFVILRLSPSIDHLWPFCSAIAFALLCSFFSVFVLHSLLFSICYKMYTKKKRQWFYSWAPGCGRSVFSFFFFNKCAWINIMRASTYNMEIKVTWIVVLNLGLGVLEKHMRSC